MLGLVLLVFMGVFAVIALVLFAGIANSTQRRKRTIFNLDTALARNKRTSSDEVIDVRKAEQLSALPWLNNWLASIEVAPRVQSFLNQADVKWSAASLLTVSGICFVVPTLLVYARSGSLVFALLFGVLGAAVPFLVVRQKRISRFRKFEQGLPEALDLMVSSMRAGQSLAAALRLVAYESPDPIGNEFRICFDEQNYGLELRAALENLIDRVPLQDLRIVVTGILIQKESGGNLVEVLDKAAYVIRERFRLKQQVRVHTAQGRLTGGILACLPLVLGTMLYFMDPKVMSVLWTHPIGIKLLYLAAGMMVIGVLLIRRIVDVQV